VTAKRYAFRAKLEDAGSGGHLFVYFPFDTQAEFGTRGRVPVKATFDGVPYTGTMVKYGHPQHMMPVVRTIREQIGKDPGDTVEVSIWKDEEVRTVEIPAEFKALLKKENLLAGFEKLSLSHRREYVRWITEAKKEATRKARIQKAVEMLRSGVKTPD
jgi:hypothetical protein